MSALTSSSQTLWFLMVKQRAAMFAVTWPQTFLFYFLSSGAGCFRPARGAMLFTLSNPQIDCVVRRGGGGGVKGGTSAVMTSHPSAQEDCGKLESCLCLCALPRGRWHQREADSLGTSGRSRFLHPPTVATRPPSLSLRLSVCLFRRLTDNVPPTGCRLSGGPQVAC